VATHSQRSIDQIFISDSIDDNSFGIDSPIEKTHAQTWVKVSLEKQHHHSKSEMTSSRRYKYNKADWLSMNISLMKSGLV
jgi:hypothetical protein